MRTAQESTISIDALDLLGHGVCLYDPALAVRHWNGRLRRLGIPAAQAEGRFLPDVLAELGVEPARLGEVEAALAMAPRGGQPLAVRNMSISFPASPRSVFDLCIAPQPDGGGAVIFRNATEALRLRETFERILDSTPDGLFVIDAKRSIRFFNQACSRITGRPVEEILGGCECSEVIHCHNQDGESYAHGLCPAKAVFRGELDHQREEMLLRNAAGEERWIETTYSPVRGPSGEVEFVVGILRDVHDRKLLEEKLNQTEKLASLGQLVAGIAHEIKNPLAIILTSLDVIENQARPEEHRREASQFLREEIRRIDERLRAFLAFARPRQLRREPVVLAGIVRKHAALMGPLFPRIDIRVENPRSEPIIMGDGEQLQQVLTNLVLNAGEAIEGHGTITLRTRQSGDTAIIDVEDDGPGIPADHMARIFDPFFTTKPNGTGLGLSICYQIILAHRGTISVSRGKNGGGTLFSIRLPMSAAFEGDAPSAG